MMQTKSASSPLRPQLFRRQPSLPEGAQAQRTMPFCQSLAGIIANQRTMVEKRLRDSESFVEQDLSRGGFQEIFAANNLSNFHGRIIHDDRQMISGDIVV